MNLSDDAQTAGVLVTRGRLVESFHRVRVAVMDEGGRPVARAGDTTAVCYYRSAAKPLQALPLVEDGVLHDMGLTDPELALCAASHNGEPRHVETALSILRKAGLDEEALACGPHPPLRREEAERLSAGGREPSRAHNNCSGKHAGMLALAVHHGWHTRGYHEPAHPVQRRMLSEVARWTGLTPEEVGVGVDGCAVACFAVPLERMALSFARFAAAAARGEAPATVVAAMSRYPFMVGGTGRLCTELMARVDGRVFVKTGAEGVYGAGIPGRGMGVAVKVVDGGRRASDVALLRTLEALEVLDDADLAALSRFARPEVRNTRGEPVGEIRAAFRLEPA